MKKLLKWLGIGVGVLVLAIGVFLFSMRFHDGPLAVFSGGPFETGELAAAPDDWSFLTDRAEIEFQTLNPTTSRVVWLGVNDRRLFVVSGYMNTGYGAIWKQWPHYLDDDDRIILRIDGLLYEQRLQRVMDGPNVVPVLNEYSRKYGGGGLATADSVSSGDTWMFEVVSR
jgi:hypothetical protein